MPIAHITSRETRREIQPLHKRKTDQNSNDNGLVEDKLNSGKNTSSQAVVKSSNNVELLSSSGDEGKGQTDQPQNDSQSGIGTKRQSSEHTNKASDIVKRSALFLNHPSVARVSAPEKDSYLRSKGLSSSDILAAKAMASSRNTGQTKFDDAWYSEDRNHALMKSQVQTNGNIKPDENANGNESTEKGNIYRQPGAQSHYQNMQYNPYDSTRQSYQAGDDGHVIQMNAPELPNAIVPLTIGGFLAVYGMAALRWLNGDDFVLFPPSNSTVARKELSSRTTNSSADIPEEYTALPRETGEHSEQKQSLDSIRRDEYDYSGSDGHLQNNLEDGYNVEEDGAVEDHFDNAEQNLSSQLSSDNSMLSQDLRSLTLAIEKYSDVQERNLKAKLDEKARVKTNNAMDLLSKKLNRASDNSGDDLKHVGRVSAFEIQALIQLTEVKCDIKTICNHLTSDSPEGNNNILTKLEMISTQLQGLEFGLTHRNELKATNSVLRDDLDSSSRSVPDMDAGDTENKVDQTTSLSMSQAENQDARKRSEYSSSSTSNSCPSGEGMITPVLNGECQDLDSVDNIKSEEVNDKKSPKDNMNEGVEVGKQAVERAIQNMKDNNEVRLVKSSCQMLFLYVSNLAKNSISKQYQKIYTTNNTFKNKIGKVKFAKDVLLSVGFVDHDSYLEWQKEECQGGNDQSSANTLHEAVKLLQSLQAELK